MKKGQLWHISIGTFVWKFYSYVDDTLLYCSTGDEVVLILDCKSRIVNPNPPIVQVLTQNGIIGWCGADMLRKL